jgi:type II secretory pathway component GspD/PulD (secretin)
VPYVGALFRTSTVIRQRKELLILLTPQVLSNVQTPVALQDPVEVTKEVLDESVFKAMDRKDKMKNRLLNPLFPTNAPPVRTMSGPELKTEAK